MKLGIFASFDPCNNTVKVKKIDALEHIHFELPLFEIMHENTLRNCYILDIMLREPVSDDAFSDVFSDIVYVIFLHFSFNMCQ